MITFVALRLSWDPSGTSEQVQAVFAWNEFSREFVASDDSLHDVRWCFAENSLENLSKAWHPWGTRNTLLERVHGLYTKAMWHPCTLKPKITRARVRIYHKSPLLHWAAGGDWVRICFRSLFFVFPNAVILGGNAGFYLFGFFFVAGGLLGATTWGIANSGSITASSRCSFWRNIQ